MIQLFMGTALRRLIVLALVLAPAAAMAAGNANIFFLHHSTGRNMLAGCDARGIIAELNGRQGTNYELWDHDYNYIGLRDPSGSIVGNYGIPNDDTDPVGLHELWTTRNDAKDQILDNHRIIAFKSCYPACDITSDAMLQQYKDWYLEIRDVMDQHPEKVFVVMSPPPRHRLSTTLDEADRARAFAEWLGSAEYLGGRANVVYFDFFTRLAHPDDGGPSRNMLRWDFELSHSNGDSHPNALANSTVGPEFVNFLCDTAAEAPAPAEVMSFGELKDLFR